MVNDNFLIKQLMTHMDFTLEEAKDEVKYLYQWFKSLPDELKLYRVILADDKKDIDFKQLGSHYSTNRRNLMDSHYFATGVGNKTFLLTVLADKSLVDEEETLHNRALYPHENEITLKNKGKGVKIISVKEL
jgi:hypothetical protein